jgi:hypothetical protein
MTRPARTPHPVRMQRTDETPFASGPVHHVGQSRHPNQGVDAPVEGDFAKVDHSSLPAILSDSSPGVIGEMSFTE